MASTDTLGRRSRLWPQSNGKRVIPRTRDLLWFQKLQAHGPLPSSFLLQYVKDTHRSEKRAKERLTDLFNEGNTPHGGPYLTRPIQQFRTIDSRYNQLVYDLSPASEKALKQLGVWNKCRATRAGPWLHSFMVSCITASIELATLDRDDIQFIPQSKLLERANTELRFPVRIQYPAIGHAHKKDLIPDALFALEYKTPDGSRYRSFIIEADRSTEPATSKNHNRKSWQRNLLQYEQYVSHGLYRDHLQLKSPLLVLNVVTAEKRIEQIGCLIGRQTPSLQTHMLFQAWEAFSPVFSPPIPNIALLDGAWKRAELPAFRIDTI